MGIILWQGERLSRIGISISKHHEPIMVLSMKQARDINEAISELNSYLLTGRKEHKANYQSIITEIDNNLVRIEKKMGDITFTNDSEVAEYNYLVSLKLALKEFKELSLNLIYLRDNPKENYPGLALASETINPISLEYLGLLNSMNEDVSQLTLTEKKVRLLSLVSEARHTWTQVMNSVRLFLNSHAKNDLNNLGLYLEANADLLDRMVVEDFDFGFNDLGRLQLLLHEFKAKWPSVIDMFLNEESRADIYLMNTTVKKSAENLRMKFEQISDKQIRIANSASKQLIAQTLQVQILAIAVFIVSMVFGVVIAALVVKGTTPILELAKFASALSVEEPKQVDHDLVSRHDEAGELARAFSRMIERLAMSYRYLKYANRNLERRVDERTKELLDKTNELQVTHQELKVSHTQLLQSEKMASIGHLAAGVAHEINNPVGYVYSNLSTLSEYISELLEILDCYSFIEPYVDSEHQTLTDVKKLKEKYDLEYLREDLFNLVAESREGMNRVKEIVQSLKDFSHVDRSEFELINLHRGMDSTLNIINNEIKYKVKVVKNYGELPDVECFPGQINQVFMNLLINAAHAMDKEGQITITTEVEDQFAKISIEDNGSGIKSENLNHIFDPFFTTKSVGKGTGLGLSLSYGIIQKHGGDIRVESEVGVGTSFTILLPIAQPPSNPEIT